MNKKNYRDYYNERLKVIKNILINKSLNEIIDEYVNKDNFIDIGGSRAVFKIKDNFVLKIPFNLGGLAQNKIEYETFKSMMKSNDENVIYFNPTYLSYDSYTNDIESVVIISEETNARSIYEMNLNEMTDVKIFAKKLEKLNLADEDEASLNANVGISNITKSLVIIDYGVKNLEEFLTLEAEISLESSEIESELSNLLKPYL